MIAISIIVLLSTVIYSYALVDPNLTIISHPLWESFRNTMVQLGYHNRPFSWDIYLILIGLLFAIHYYFISSKRSWNPLKIAMIIGALMVASYPFLSHDLFNYMFTGRIMTHYGGNPYILRALDFPQDHWIRFMHWTHVTYPYGPTFLPIEFLLSLFSLGKFSLSFIIFKVFFSASYVVAVYYLRKLDSTIALFFATHPLVITEGLINNHNDFTAVCIGIIGVYYVAQNKKWLGKFLLLLSGGVKYITLPLLLLEKGQKKFSKLTKLNVAAFIGLVVALVMVSSKNGVYSWYFLNLFILLPYIPKAIRSLSIFFAGLLLSYYPFIALGEWDTERLAMKNWIIFASILINLAYLEYIHYRSKKKNSIS